ncbi:ROK family protein [Actinospica sp. MGRD01-02]|uniref:ROK family protein n=1 Tax=Actinospica acidithermotolerans TaxID=2828514 RepID=A0A941ECV5_9ACTN|nr:ROK family protein [Actinospica acidithermotolerans]MBR7828055.1 ROK family protein [Actinospica acidithermotolerans]
MQQRAVLAIDIGGTKLAVGIVDEEGRVLETRRAPNPNPPVGDGEAVLRALLALIDQLEADRRELIGVGVGCGGPMKWPAGEVSPLNIPTWRDFPLRDRLAEEFGLPVHIHNDAICLAVAEHWRGAGTGVDNVLGMVVSTGVGGGLILGGRLIDGATGNAGHIGHAIVHEFEPRCRCGAIGCLEAIASGPNLADWAHGQGWRPGHPLDQRSGQDLVEDARRGDPIALTAMRRAGRALGIGIATATTLCDLQVVAIGGGLSQAGPLLFDPLEASMRERVGLDYARAVRVVPAGLGQESGLVGAAALILRPDRYWSAEGKG